MWQRFWWWDLCFFAASDFSLLQDPHFFSLEAVTPSKPLRDPLLGPDPPVEKRCFTVHTPPPLFLEMLNGLSSNRTFAETLIKRLIGSGSHSHVVALLVSRLLRHQDVVLLRRVPLPVRHLLAVRLHLLHDTKPPRTWDPSGPTNRQTPPPGGCHPTHPDDGEGVLLLVVQVLLDVEEGVEEDVGELAPLQVAQGDPSWGRRGGTYIRIDSSNSHQIGWVSNIVSVGAIVLPV